MGFTREKLQAKHLRAIGDFECKEESMECFLKNDAYDYDKNGEGNTYLLIDDDTNKILAYYTLKCNAIEIIQSDRCHKILPAIEIARLAVDINSEGRGIGSSVLALIMHTVLLLRKHVGIKYLFLFSVPNAIKFYKSTNKAELKFKDFPDSIRFLKDENSQDGCKALFVTLDSLQEKIS